MGKARPTDFKFGMHIYGLNRNKSPLKIREKYNRGRCKGLLKIFRTPIYRAHHAVSFVIAQLSCSLCPQCLLSLDFWDFKPTKAAIRPLCLHTSDIWFGVYFSCFLVCLVCLYTLYAYFAHNDMYRVVQSVLVWRWRHHSSMTAYREVCVSA